MDAVNFDQADRNVRAETPLGDIVAAESFEISEGINQFFSITLNFRAKGDIKPEELIGKACDASLRKEVDSTDRRYWNGVCFKMIEGPPVARGYRAYQIVLGPEAEKLTYRVNCKVWQNKTSLDVLQELFSEHGLRAPIIRVFSPPKKQIFSQQYNESDWDYLLRRLQVDGLYYYFLHSGGTKGSVAAKHEMVVCDDANGYSKSDEPNVRYAHGSADVPHITKLDRTRKYSPGQAAVTEYNFKTPAAIPSGFTPSLVKLPGNSKSEIFRSAPIGGYGSGDASDEINNRAAETASKLFMKACEAEYETNKGESSVSSLAPGHRIKPFDVTNPGAAFDEIVISKITHTARTGAYESEDDDAPDYSNSFEALPASVPATPHCTVPKPSIHGNDVAIVVGPPGEQIYTDEHGRVRITLTRNREAKRDGTDSCWVRVAQNWAGATFGGLILPRIGMHVLVAYESGDMDRPIVVGYMPNPVQKQAYGLPANKTRSTFRSQTHKGDGFNEWSMEDDNGNERFFVHAQKDMTARVLNDQTARIDRHHVHSVGGNQSAEVTKNVKQEIGGSFNLTVGGTGAGAPAALAKVAGLAGQTAGLLQQAGSLAGGGGAELGTFAASIAGSALGFLSGGGLSSREGVVAGSPPGSDAGKALAAAGTGVGQDLNGLFPLPGVMNTVAGLFTSNSVGIASVEQIGLSKVTNVGKSSVTNVGKAQLVTVGETTTINVGNTFTVNVGGTEGDPMASLTMKNDGTIVLYAKNSITIKPVELLAGESKQVQFDASSLFYAHSDKDLTHDAGKRIGDTAPEITLTGSTGVWLDGGHIGLNDGSAGGGASGGGNGGGGGGSW